jgi:hypothetical protein
MNVFVTVALADLHKELASQVVQNQDFPIRRGMTR